MLAKAGAKHPEVPLLCADATDLPTYGFDFDLVLALNAKVFRHRGTFENLDIS